MFHKKQNEFKKARIYLYWIKCDKIICSNYLLNHLEINGENYHVFSTEYIIKNNEKFTFWLECNTHICKEYMKSKKHKGHKKDNIIEVLVTEKIKNILNGIINIHNGRIIK